MATVLIPTIFQGPTRGASKAEVPGKTIGTCLDLVEELYPGVRELIVDSATGAIHRFVKVTLNGDLLPHAATTLATPVAEKDEIEVIAAIAGG